MEFPEDRLRQRRSGEDRWVYVHDLVADLRQAFDQGCLLSEIWSQNGNEAPTVGNPFELSGYRSFGGLKSDSTLSFAHS